jgi:hypothetical protein
VIIWKDFILDDDVLGAIMIDPTDDDKSFESCRRTRLGSTIIMEDENGIIQEQRPARMVGHSSLDSLAEPHMDVSSSDRASTNLWPRGKT